jgi:hypothetical protein
MCSARWEPRQHHSPERCGDRGMEIARQTSGRYSFGGDWPRVGACGQARRALSHENALKGPIIEEAPLCEHFAALHTPVGKHAGTSTLSPHLGRVSDWRDETPLHAFLSLAANALLPLKWGDSLDLPSGSVRERGQGGDCNMTCSTIINRTDSSGRDLRRIGNRERR